MGEGHVLVPQEVKSSWGKISPILPEFIPWRNDNSRLGCCVIKHMDNPLTVVGSRLKDSDG